MEGTTFQDPQVKELLAGFKVIRIDVTKNSLEDQKIMHYFNVIAPPSFLFFDKEGKALNQLKTVGEVSTGEFIKILKRTE